MEHSHHDGGNGNGFAAGERAARIQQLERDVGEIKSGVHALDQRQRKMELTLTEIAAGLVSRERLEADHRLICERIGLLEAWSTSTKAKWGLVTVLISSLWSLGVGLAVAWFKRSP